MSGKARGKKTEAVGVLMQGFPDLEVQQLEVALIVATTHER